MTRPASAHAPAEIGARTAAALRGAWRRDPPSPVLTPAALEELAPHLHATGSAGLAWWVIKDSPAHAATSAATELNNAFRMTALQLRLHEVRLAGALDLVAGLGLEPPLLLKGWGVARAYPSPGLRPCGDVDFAVPAAEHVRLQQALDAREHDRDWIRTSTLEHRFLTADGTPLRELVRRAMPAAVDGRPVLLPGHADQLRLVAIHYLRSGGWHPRALVDVALLLEGVPDDLDWDIALGTTRQRQWMTVAAGLAQDLLGADLRASPLADAASAVPPWVRQHVLDGFATTSGAHHRLRPPFRLRASPADLLRQLRERTGDDALALTLHHGRRIPARSPVAVRAYDLGYRAAAMALPVRLRRARRDGSPEVAR